MKQIPLRLSLRDEGDWWVAYVGDPYPSQGRTELGRIRMNIVRPDVDLRDRFKELMTDFLRRFVKDKFGQDPDMIETPAPESERGGHA